MNGLNAAEFKRDALYLCSDLISIEWQSGKSAKHVIANLEAIHARGAELCCECRIPKLKKAILFLDGRPFDCQVTNCLKHEALGYLITVRFKRGNPWSLDVYTPKHLLNIDDWVKTLIAKDIAAATPDPGRTLRAIAADGSAC